MAMFTTDRHGVWICCNFGGNPRHFYFETDHKLFAVQSNASYLFPRLSGHLWYISRHVVSIRHERWEIYLHQHKRRLRSIYKSKMHNLSCNLSGMFIYNQSCHTIQQRINFFFLRKLCKRQGLYVCLCLCLSTN